MLNKDIPTYVQTRHKLADCTRGCTDYGKHETACLCTPECPEHGGHCNGCQPTQATTGRYCQPCADTFRDALDAIPNLVTLVAQLPNARIAQGDTSRRPTKVDQQSPSPAWDTADEVILWAASWAWIIAGRPGYDPIRYSNAGLPVRDLSSSITHITNRLTQALTDDYHADLYQETTQLHKRLVYATGTNKLSHRLPGTCLLCDRKSLERANGSELVKCRACGATWDWEQYEFLARAYAEGVRAEG